ncbi:MAG: hypothetical protein AAFO84_12600 [Cyanobacteria bacterium J06598_1]
MANSGITASGVTAAMGLRQAERQGLIVCSGWALLSLVIFAVGAFVGDRADWFVIVVSLLKTGSFLIATALCSRNASNPDTVSGRSVWQAIALGMLFYAFGDITVILWRSLWGITSAVSLGDVFYGVSYLFLAIGLLQAVLPRQINLNLPQALGISITGLIGILLASWINFYLPAVETGVVGGGAITLIQPGPQPGPRLESKSAAAGAVTSTSQEVPVIIQTIETRLGGIARHLGLVYVVGDCALVVMAVALLVAFWGGSYSETWKLVALAGLCLYVADMFLIYQVSQNTYQQGAIWEIFWVLSALFFGLSAGVEHGISTQMKTRSRRHEWL